MPSALTTYKTRFLLVKRDLGNVFTVLVILFVCVIWIADHASTCKLFSFDDITMSIQQDKRTEEGNFDQTPTSITVRGWFYFLGLGFIDCVSDDFHPPGPCKFTQELIDHGMECFSSKWFLIHADMPRCSESDGRRISHHDPSARVAGAERWQVT